MATTPFAASRFQFTTDGASPGYVRKFMGGDLVADKVESKLGAFNENKKSISGVKYEALTVELAMSMGKAMWDWADAAFNYNASKKNFETALADANGNIQMSKVYMDCLLSEFTIPKLDASSKDLGWLTLKIQPQTTRVTMGGGGKVAGEQGKNVQKQWLCNSFRLDIAGLDCSQVKSIDSITFKLGHAVNDLGQFRENEIIPTSVTMPDLKVVISAVTAQTWYDKYKSFVVDGNCSDADELTGTLEFLAGDMNTVLGSLEFRNMGITKFSMDAAEAGKDAVMNATIEFYVEGVRLKPGVVDM